MRFPGIVCFVATLLLTAPVVAAAADAAPMEVRFSAYYPEHYPVFKCGWTVWEKMVTDESNGQFVFKNYLNGVLHSAKHGFRATMSGVTDLTHAYPSYAPKSFDLSKVNDLPFLFPQTHIGPLIMEELYTKYFKKEYEKMGVYLGAWVNVSGYNLISKKPVRTLDDLKGMKIRSTGGPCTDFLAALGAVPVMMQSAESYTGLQSGVVDGVLYPAGSAVSYKLYEVAKYFTVVEIMHMGVPYALNKQFFDRLSPEQKKFFYAKLRQASQIASHSYDIDDREAYKVLARNGVEIITLSDAEKVRMHKAVQPVIDKFVADLEAKGLPGKAMMADIQRLNEQYKDLTPEAALEKVTQTPFQGIINF